MKIEVGPTGNLITGTIFDVNRTTLEALVKRYDSQLYLKWNPKKKRGMGTWELRRRPIEKIIVDSTKIGDVTISRLEYKENDIENHVWDLDYLGYGLLNRLKRCDVWNQINFDSNKMHRVDQFLDTLDNNYYSHKESQEQKTRDELVYNMKQDKKAIKQLQENIASGFNPNHIARYWK